ncbi:MAG: GldG family protein [Myxococcota bacterium]|nr:GldG family protein [Myxococcota bacterium]
MRESSSRLFSLPLEAEAVMHISPRRQRQLASAASQLLVLAAALLTLSLAQHAFFQTQIDLTPELRYTLAPISKGLLERAPAPISVEAFLPLSAPPPYQQVVRRARDLLEAYQNQSPRSFFLRVHDSAGAESLDEQAALRARAARFSIQESALMIRQGDRQVQLTIPFGVAFECGDPSAIAPPPQSEEELEYQFTRALRAVIDRPPALRIGVSQGHGEPQLMNSPLAKRLGQLAALSPLALDGPWPEQPLDVLLIFAPRKQLSARAGYLIEQLALRGTSVVFFLDQRTQSQAVPSVWIPQQSGLERLLSRWGFKLESRWTVADQEHPGLAPLRRDAQAKVALAEHPLYPLTRQLEKHPINEGRARVLFPMGVPLRLSEGASSLIESEASARAYYDLRSLNLTESRESRAGPFILAAVREGMLSPLSQEAVAASIQSPLTAPLISPQREPPRLDQATRASRIVLFTSGARLLSAHPEQLSLLERSLEWALREETLGALRARRAQPAPLELKEEARRHLRLGLHFSPLILLLLTLALLRWRPRRR